MKILVTGATGFIGRAVTRDLLLRNHSVGAIVRGRGTAPSGTEEVCVGEIGARTSWDGALSGADAVIHLAARVHVMRDTAVDPELAFRDVNTAGTLSLAQACIAQGVPRLVFMSTIKVNGERTSVTPFQWDQLPDPADPYAISKHEAEVGLEVLGGSLESFILRPSVVYGPGVGGNIRRLALAVRQGIPLPLGNLQNSRSLTSLHNLVRAVSAAVEQTSVPEGPILVTDSTAISTTDLVRSLAAGIGRRARLLPVPAAVLLGMASLVGRREDASRLVQDLQVTPRWDALDVNESQLIGPYEGLKETGEGFMRVRR